MVLDEDVFGVYLGEVRLWVLRRDIIIYMIF